MNKQIVFFEGLKHEVNSLSLSLSLSLSHTHTHTYTHTHIYTYTHTHTHRGLQFLRDTQQLDGSWPARDNTDVPYFSYHAAMCAVSALNPQRFRGFGPSDPALLQELMNSRLKKSNISQMIFS